MTYVLCEYTKISSLLIMFRFWNPWRNCNISLLFKYQIRRYVTISKGRRCTIRTTLYIFKLFHAIYIFLNVHEEKDIAMDIGNIKISNRAMSNRDDVVANNSRRDKSIVQPFLSSSFFLSFRISKTSRCKRLCVLNGTSWGRRDARFSIRLAHTRKNKRFRAHKDRKVQGLHVDPGMAERHSRRTLVGGDAVERENRCNGDCKYYIV